jgi:hypothetical protein
LIYRKGVKDDLSVAEKKVLRKLNANWQEYICEQEAGSAS